ncbi:MAG TPA: MAE_28990/MAE_18760 family HEPN-like nuclease [Terriglobales bacterium]|nr:MAE_28990/MAE_18760 family HEPN-like nuclease [Terriglobales bacterium]
MRIRTTEQLVDAMSAEISWRRKELTDLRYLVQQAVGHTRQRVMTRAGVALLYAHWEGFIKAAAEIYLEFVCMQRCKNSELAASMLAIMVRSKLHAAHASKKIAAHLELVDFFREQMEERSTLPHKNVIRTDANVSSTVLLEILGTLGLDSDQYEAKAHMIDNQLLAKRNHIAHGSDLDVDGNDYLRLHEEMLSLMDLLRNQIENAAIMKQYLAPVIPIVR